MKLFSRSNAEARTAKGSSRLRWWAGGVLLLLASTAAIVLLGSGRVLLFARAFEADWMIEALTSPLSVLCAGILVASGVCLIAIARLMCEAGRVSKAARGAESGQVILEFALVLPIALMLVLIMTQSSLLMGGNICVHYSAYCAARTAIVQIPDNLSPSEPPNELASGPQSHKRLRIHQAAVWAIAPVSCSSHEFSPGDASELVDGVDGFFDGYELTKPGWVREDYLGRKLEYADQYTTVRILRRVGSAETDSPEYDDVYNYHIFAERDEIRTEVEHTFYLSIPYANWLYWTIGNASINRDGRELDFGSSEYGIVIRAASSLINQGSQDYIEVEQFY